MKKLFFTCSLLLTTTILLLAQAPAGMPANMPAGGQAGMPQMPNQSAMFPALTVSNGTAYIDGKNGTNAVYSYTGADSVLNVSLTNIADKESVIVFYSKTTASNLLMSFPAGTNTKQPTTFGGVTVNGTTITLQSSATGAFQIMVQNKGGINSVVITRTAQ